MNENENTTTEGATPFPFTREQAENGWAFHLREQQAQIDEAKAAAVGLALELIDDLYWTVGRDAELEVSKLRKVAAVIHCLDDLDNVEFTYAMHEHGIKLATQAEEVDA